MEKNRFEDDNRLLIEDEARPAKKGKGRWILVLLILGGLGYGGYRWWSVAKPAAADATQPTDNAGGGGGRGRGGRGRGGGGGRPAVVTVAARKVDMPVYLTGLGTVTAFNTVTVRSRVDGQLVHVAFKEGQFVNQGDLLAEIDKRPFEVQLAQAKGQLARDQALLASAMTEQSRNQLLLQRGLIPKQQVDLQAATIGQYEGAIQADQAQIDNANLQITYSRIPAPISGQIGLRLVDEGNIVRAADPGGLVVITQLQPISVLFSIPEDDLGKVLKKLRAGDRLRAEAWDHDYTMKIADGTLLTADNQIDPTTGTSKLKAVFDNKNNALYPNQFVNIKLLVDVLKNAIVIPGATIQRGSQGTFVYTVNENQTAELRVVNIQNTEGNDVALSSGVQAGEMVVLEGMDKVQEGGKVDVQTPGQGTDASAGPRNGGGGGRGGKGGFGRGGRGGDGGRERGQRNGQ
jgi:multidrug efflux system membrane fusion protein